jgi:hypothetical protein
MGSVLDFVAMQQTQAYACLHGTARRMAALAGVVRAGAESGSFEALPRAPIQSVLASLETRLAEVAVRPGHGAVSRPEPETLAVELVPPLPFERFLAEQADYADAHIAAAHAAATVLRQPDLAAAPPGFAHGT